MALSIERDPTFSTISIFGNPVGVGYGNWERKAESFASDLRKQRIYIAQAYIRGKALLQKTRASLKAPTLRYVKLEGFDFQGASLTGADLRGSHFTECNMSGVDFSKANISNANWNDVDLTGAKLRDVKFNDTTSVTHTGRPTDVAESLSPLLKQRE